MKITKNMYYEKSWESDELFLYSINSDTLYVCWTISAICNLHRKYQKGTFDKDKAVILFYHMTTDAAKEYQAEIDADTQFSVNARWTAACDLLKYYMEDIEKGI